MLANEVKKKKKVAAAAPPAAPGLCWRGPSSLITPSCHARRHPPPVPHVQPVSISAAVFICSVFQQKLVKSRRLHGRRQGAGKKSHPLPSPPP